SAIMALATPEAFHAETNLVTTFQRRRQWNQQLKDAVYHDRVLAGDHHPFLGNVHQSAQLPFGMHIEHFRHLGHRAAFQFTLFVYVQVLCFTHLVRLTVGYSACHQALIFSPLRNRLRTASMARSTKGARSCARILTRPAAMPLASSWRVFTAAFTPRLSTNM